MKKLFPLAALVAVLSAPVAFADAGASSPSPSLSSILLAALGTAVPVLVTAVFGLLAAWLSGLTGKLQADAETSRLAAVGARASALAESIVRNIEVTLRPQLVVAMADGKLTAEEGKKLKDAAMAELMRTLGDRGLAELQQVFRLTSGSVSTFLSGLIEAALDRVKAGRSVDVADQVINTALSMGAIGSTSALAPAVAAGPQTPRG